jgi:uncharacterized OB-fold protein
MSDKDIVAEEMAEKINLAGDALAEDADGILHLIGTLCRDCDTRLFPPVEICPECLSEELAPVALSQHGTLYSWSVVHVAPKGWRLPYIAGYVDLPDGVRVFAHIVGAASDALAFDMAVELCRAELGTGEDGRPVESYAFTPAATPSATPSATPAA